MVVLIMKFENGVAVIVLEKVNTGRETLSPCQEELCSYKFKLITSASASFRPMYPYQTVIKKKLTRDTQIKSTHETSFF